MNGKTIQKGIIDKTTRKIPKIKEKKDMIELKSVQELTKDMDDIQLRTFAKGEALATCDSAQIEGLDLNQPELEEEFFNLYKELIANHD